MYELMTRKATHNSTLAIGGVSSPLDSFVVAESSVLRTNFCAEKREVAYTDVKLKSLDDRFWLSSTNLSSDKYKLYQDQIIQEKAEKEQRLYDLRKKLSNSEMFINEAIDIARNIQYYWGSSDLETKLKLQKTVFPKGLWINPSHRGYLTRHVNYFFRRIPLFSRALNWGKMKKVTVSGDFPLLVAGTGLEPVTFGL